jgi:hypothetical protein
VIQNWRSAKGLGMTRISQPIFVMAFVAAIIFAAALLLSTVINSADRPIEADPPAVSVN